MSKRILNCLYNEILLTEAELVKKLHEESLLLPNNWTPTPVVKAIAWAKNHPIRVHIQLHKLMKQGLVDQSGSNFNLSRIGLLRASRSNLTTGEPETRDLRLVTS